MPSLLLLDHGRWSRQELAAPAGYAALKTGGVPLVTVGEGRLAGQPEDVVGVILLCAGQPYYLAAAGSVTYLNAAARPLMPLHRLRDRDRLTYQAADGSQVRVWHIQESQIQRYYDGAPLGLKCGYCSVDFALGEEIAVCACKEAVHADCLAHGGGKCPRCDAPLAPKAEPWRPEGFPDESEEPDDWG